MLGCVKMDFPGEIKLSKSFYANASRQWRGSKILYSRSVFTETLNCVSNLLPRWLKWSFVDLDNRCVTVMVSIPMYHFHCSLGCVIRWRRFCGPASSRSWHSTNVTKQNVKKRNVEVFRSRGTNRRRRVKFVPLGLVYLPLSIQFTYVRFLPVQELQELRGRYIAIKYAS